MEHWCGKIKIALDETRMLALGVQVLISLQFELFFQNTFEKASQQIHGVIAVTLLLLMATFALLLWGPAYHRIVARGACTDHSHRFLTWAACCALWPLSAALGLDVFVAFDRICPRAPAIAAGFCLVLICWALWYLPGAFARKPRSAEALMATPQSSPPKQGPNDKLHRRVELALTEARVVLPGAQAMLGFQFIIMFTQQFDELPQSSKFLHLACLALTAITVVLLMTPAAFHRIAEHGEESERLVKLTGHFVMAAMVPLAMTMAGEVYVVIRKVTASNAIATTCGVMTVSSMFAMWFGYTLLQRGKRPASPTPIPSPPR
jgi:hypothetical protein